MGDLDNIVRQPTFQQLHGTSSPDPRELPTREASTLLQNDIHTDQFAIEELLVVDWEVFEAKEINYQTILKKSSFFVTRDEKDGHIRAFSFLATAEVKLGWRTQADFYCKKGDNDPRLATAHVLAHMQKLQKFRSTKSIIYMLLYPENYPGYLSRDALQSQLGLAPGPYNQYPEILVVYDNAEFLQAHAKL